MNRIKPDVDIILDVLKHAREYYPASNFIESLLYQYQERGGLSKKQLEGLYSKSLNVQSIAPGKLATLEAIIKKKPTRHRSPASVPASLAPANNELLEKQISDILEKYPLHKRVVFIKSKLDNNEAVSALEKSEITRFHTLLIK